MTPEERSMIDGLFDRIKGAASQPRDAEAEAVIARRVQEAPYAPYVLAQTVLVQEHALQQANARIQELEAQARAQPQADAPQAGSFLGGLFGGGRGTSVPTTGNRAMPIPQQAAPVGYGAPAQSMPQGGYSAPGYAQQQPPAGPWGGQRGGFGGGGFLQGALATAAGVAGGALLFDGIRNLMSGGTGPIADQAAQLQENVPADLGGAAESALAGTPWGGQDGAPAQDAAFQGDGQPGDQGFEAQDASYDDGGWDAGGDDSSWA